MIPAEVSAPDSCLEPSNRLFISLDQNAHTGDTLSDHNDPTVRREAALLTSLIIRHARVRRTSRDFVPYFSYSSMLESLPE